MTPDWTAYLEQRRAEAETALQTQLGSQTACEIHKDGRVTGGIKYAEGRLVALNALLRQARAASAPASDQVAHELARWQAELAHYQTQPNRSIPWLAYCQGGVDACTAAHKWLAETA